MKDRLKIMQQKVKEDCNFLMDQHMKENGCMINLMEKVLIILLMVLFMKGNLFMDRSVEEVNSNFQMVHFMKEIS